MLLGSVSSRQRFGATDIKALSVTALGSWTNSVIALRQISVTALFCLEDSRRIHPPGVRACRPKDAKRREWRSMPAGAGVEVGAVVERDRESPSALFLHVLSSPGPALCKLGQPGVLLVLAEVLTLVLGPSLDLPLFCFPGLFPSLCFSHRHFGLLFPILTT